MTFVILGPRCAPAKVAATPKTMVYVAARPASSPKLRRLGNANPWLSWGLPLFGVVVSDYAALSGIAVSSSWKARRWSGVASVSMGISVLVWW